MFGISSAPELYQHVIQQVLTGCAGAHNIADDIIVHGKTPEEHDSRLRLVLECLKRNGLTLKRAKCQIGLPKVQSMSHPHLFAGTKLILYSTVSCLFLFLFPYSYKTLLFYPMILFVPRLPILSGILPFV